MIVLHNTLIILECCTYLLNLGCTSEGELTFILSPVSSIVSIGGLIGGLIDLVGNDDDERLADLSQKIDEILVLLHDIDNQLNVISEKLDELKVLVNDASAKRSRDLVWGSIETILHNWKRWVERRRSRKEAEGFLLTLMRENRVLMRTGGHAYCLDVAFGAVFEINTAFLVGYTKPQLQPSVNRILRYLRDCIDPSGSGSVAYQLNSVREEISVLETWEAALVRQRFVATERHVTYEGRHGHRTCRFDIYNVITGDLTNGLTTAKDWRNKRLCKFFAWNGIQPRIGNPTGIQAVALPNPGNAFDQAALDRARREYLRLKHNEQVLEQTVWVVERVIAWIENRMSIQFP